MKKYFVVSLVKNGLIGGGISADSEAITYRTGKVTIPREYRHLVMKYEDICEVSSDGPLYNSARLHLGDRVLVKYKEITLFLCHAGRGVIGGGGSEESHSVQAAGGWSARGLLF